MHPCIYCSAIYNSQAMDTTQVPINRYTECYSGIKKKEILPFVTARMDLEVIMLSEVSQSEKDKYYTYM